ncbi:MAG TPA: LptF/LptG family permease [Pyrinomonadaceae bacterium]|nr:LptF/LptG family permease [Pyrinomonadaceae bacterium]
MSWSLPLSRPWRAIDGYLVSAALPYVLLSLTILSAILLIQQTTRFAEVLGSTETPMHLTLQVAANILPSILIFTLPTSVLVGTATGFGQLGQDSELVAIRAAGVGTLRIIAPLMFLGMLLSLLNFYVAFVVSPVSAQNLRDIGLQAALYRLESPVEPRSFYTGMPGKVVYVREGDKERGLWGKIFIQWEEGGGVRLVTARSGRLDFSGEQAELVLDDALLTTLPPGGFEAFAKGAHVTIERSANMRLRDERLDLGRGSIASRLREREPELDELGWAGLLERARNASSPKVSREASIVLHRRLTLALSPVVFAFFGAGLGLKVVRGGRSKGVLLSLFAMLLYYLLSLAGEQLGRAGTVQPFLGSWLAFFTAVCAGVLLLFKRRWSFNFPIYKPAGKVRKASQAAGGAKAAGRYVTLLGLLDKSIFNSLAFNFLLIVSALVSIFMVFTLFELIRFIAAHGTAPALVVRYLLYLLPFACIAVTPVGALLASLVTFALMSRRNESVAWWSSGQSVYRFILPCIFFATLLGACVWLLQDKVMPEANRRQNALRGVIRSGGAQAEAQKGRRWVASADSRRIYNYSPPGPGGELTDLVVFNFDREALHLERVYLAPSASPAGGTALEMREAQVVDFGDGRVGYTHQSRILVEAEAFEAFNSGLNRPMEFGFEDLSAYISALKQRGVDVQPLAIALQRRLVEPFLPLVMIIVGSPLAFVFGRRGTLLALCFGIGVGLLFLGLMSVAQQVGSSGLISAGIAAWAPPALFSAAGLYMLSRTRT